MYREICKKKGDIIERNRKRGREMESLERIIEEGAVGDVR
jgi:hypothetical protein